MRTNQATAVVHRAIAGRRRLIGQNEAEVIMDAAEVINEAALEITVDMTEALREMDQLEADLRGFE
ncbi:hypothetical protein AB0I34_06940 [Kribbella sp. NPDC050281]|uniref:hypothetical protein n=1 Tax=Kribbella sp. NPDC050281 TaxID=3155515 RepID=UPI0033C001BF